MAMTDWDEATFEAHRPLLFSIAYRMLGSASEAEDVVQDAWLRARQDEQADVRSPRAYLTTIVTRLCIDHLRSAERTRMEYPGPWLPEPLAEPNQESAELVSSMTSRTSSSCRSSFLGKLKADGRSTNADLPSLRRNPSDATCRRSTRP